MKDGHPQEPGRRLNRLRAGGKPPQALWGRTVLYSRLHCSTSTAACANEQKISPFNSSSLSLPLKLSL